MYSKNYSIDIAYGKKVGRLEQHLEQQAKFSSHLRWVAVVSKEKHETPLQRIDHTSLLELYSNDES